MKYIVMECHFSYAVVLDEEGNFLKVANLHYEVGQIVSNVVEMQMSHHIPKANHVNRWMYSMVAVASCLVLMVTSVLQINQMTYASVYMTINPEVRIDVNRKDIVVGIEGVNVDGVDLIEGYNYQKKDLDLVVDELVDRAIDMGYLHKGGQISLVLDADSEEWVTSRSDTLTTHLNKHLGEKLSVIIEVSSKKEQSNQVTIPIGSKNSDYGESDYGEQDDEQYNNQSDNDDFEDKESDYSSSDYGDTSNNENSQDNDYYLDDNVDESNNIENGQTDDESNDDVSDYETSDYETSRD